MVLNVVLSHSIMRSAEQGARSLVHATVLGPESHESFGTTIPVSVNDLAP